MKFMVAMIAAAAILGSSSPSSAMDAAAARHQACTEFSGRWSGTGCNGLGSKLDAFKRRVEALSGQGYTKPSQVTLNNGVVLPRATVEAHRRCKQVGGEWRLTGTTGVCSK